MAAAATDEAEPTGGNGQAGLQAASAEELRRLLTAAEAREAALAEVLSIINVSPGDPRLVFDATLENAMRLCQVAFGLFYRVVGENFELVTHRGVPADFAAHRAAHPPTRQTSIAARQILQTKRPVHILDRLDTETYPAADTSVAGLGGARTLLVVPLLKDGAVLGVISVYRQEVRTFSDKDIALLEGFAAQAVVAMENARLLTEQREALERQTATSEVLATINASPGDLQPVFESMLEKCLRLCDSAFGFLRTYDGTFLHTVATRNVAPEFVELLSKPARAEPGTVRERMVRGEDIVHVVDLMSLPLDQADNRALARFAAIGGARTALWVALRKDGMLRGIFNIFRHESRPFTDTQIALVRDFAAQAVIAMENARLLGELRAARDAAEASLADLRRAQDRLVQSEKMASLGQLTAGIAHEIKNPLNFVNNFSDLSADLLDELNAVLAPVEQGIGATARDEIEELTATLKGNLAKIAEHGRRADAIVRNMLEHSRTGASERRTVDLNAMAEEALNLAYHGARAEIPGFNITLEKTFDPAIGAVEVYPQELTRVLVNLINNGFYAARKRGEAMAEGFEPTLSLETRDLGDQVEIRVRDNGTGIPADIREKIFEPFFTTKPAGQGTGLGLSLSYDIVVKQHGGQLRVESEPGVFTEFTITLPRHILG